MESAVNPPYPSQDDIQKAIEVLEISALKLDPNSEEHKFPHGRTSGFARLWGNERLAATASSQAELTQRLVP